MARQPTALQVIGASFLFFLSGWAALVYEVLWMKQVSLLFGNSAQAAASTLAAFFIGIAAGNAFWGRRASKLARPLLVYGVLELCVTLSAVLYFAVYFVYDSMYPTLFSIFDHAPKIFTLTKFALALILFFPAAFFMGGTLPVMTQYLVRKQEMLGKRASILYAINTFGAACGALMAGFYLPQALGMNKAYLLAMTATVLVGLAAVALGRSHFTPETGPNPDEMVNKQVTSDFTFAPHTLVVLAALSGFASLALQVLWIRMFAQVLHNSVYTYSAILSVFLIALAIGGTIARELARRKVHAAWFLPSLLTLTALLIAASPTFFHALTDSGSYLGAGDNFTVYLFRIFAIVAAVIGVPTMVIGILLPYMFKLAEGGHYGPGETVGRLVTINTAGAIFGSIAAGFLLLDWIGLWSSLNVIAIIYIGAAFWVLIERSVQNVIPKLVPIFGLLLLVTVLDASRLPIVKVDPVGKNEALLKVWEGADATVAVVRRNGHLRTKLNNWYTLGSTGDMTTQQTQTHLPLLLHSNPSRVFYLGLGTGITAGTALNYKVDEVVVTEISPSAIRASEEFFADHTNDLFSDPRVTVIAEDGRNVLRGSRDKFDIIISDLFIPWKAGTGTLYSVDHYDTAFKRLNAGGLYAQWLPLYQLTQDEFAIIARSMLEVFPAVSLWRGNFSGKRAVIALIGHQEIPLLSPNTPLLRTSERALREDADRIPLIAHYAGTLRPDDARLSIAPLNTDSKPVIEYLAPVNHRREKAGQASWFVGQEMLDFLGPYVTTETLLIDSYLSDIDPVWYDAIQAGYYLQASYVLKDQGHKDSSTARSSFQSLLKRTATSLQ